MVNEAAVATMPTTEAEGTEVAGDKLCFYIQECPMDKNCKGPRWRKNRWGYTRDEAILKFRDHLWNKHSIKDPELVEDLCGRLVFECYIGDQRR